MHTENIIENCKEVEQSETDFDRGMLLQGELKIVPINIWIQEPTESSPISNLDK
jgi:hypothetical protein